MLTPSTTLPKLLPDSMAILGFLFAMTFALTFVPWIVKAAARLGFMDMPGERKIHKHPVARFGGVSIVTAFVLTLGVLFALKGSLPLAHGWAGLLLGGGIMFALGALDDALNLSPYIKLPVQVLAAWAAYQLGIQVTVLDLPFQQLLPLGDLSLPITLLWLVGISNAFNFIDGVDGLAGGVSLISALTLAIVALFTHQIFAALIAAILAGAAMGFLVYNTHPARIFMGDGGSLFCGFMLASISVTGVLKTPVAVMLVPVMILSVPILDVTYSTMRRLLAGKNPFRADKGHIHHKLLDAGLGHRGIVKMMYGVCIISGLGVAYYVHSLLPYVLLLCGTGLLMFALLQLRFSSEKSEVLSSVSQAPNVPVSSPGNDFDATVSQGPVLAGV